MIEIILVQSFCPLKIKITSSLCFNFSVLLVKTHQCARNVTFIFHSKFVWFGGTFILALYVQLALINALVNGIACKQCSCNLQF